MGADPDRSVVDPTGAVHGGVNPMLTIMAMARRVALQHGGRETERTASGDAVRSGTRDGAV